MSDAFTSLTTSITSALKVGFAPKKQNPDRTVEESPSSIPPPSPKEAPPTLLALSRELRNIIYTYVLSGHVVIPKPTGNRTFRLEARPSTRTPRFASRSLKSPSHSKARTWHALFNLSKTCHQLRAETHLLPYKLNVFIAVIGFNFSIFIGELQDDQRDAIRTVAVGLHHIRDFLEYEWVEEDPAFESVVTVGVKRLAGLRTLVTTEDMCSAIKLGVTRLVEKRRLKLVYEVREPHLCVIQQLNHEGECWSTGLDAEEDEQRKEASEARQRFADYGVWDDPFGDFGGGTGSRR